MKATVATRWSEPSELEYLDVADPEANRGQALIETRAAGCNFPDILIIQGKYRVKPPTRSASRGADDCRRQRHPVRLPRGRRQALATE
jgi:NADPH:quinone reductase-like Zn-dependent oxidoreductase